MEADKKKIRYNAEEDFRFPVGLLLKAYWKLRREGYDQFYIYADSIGMPANDIERVMSKYRYETDSEYRDKINEQRALLKKKLSGDFQMNEIPF